MALIHFTAGKALKSRNQMLAALAAIAMVAIGFVFIHMSNGGYRPGLVLCAGLISAGAVIELRTRGKLGRAGKPALNFGDRAFLYWRKSNGPPEEISYAEVLSYHSTQVAYGEENHVEVFVTIEFRKQRQIRLRSSYLDIKPGDLLALLKIKMESALPEENT